MPPPPPPYESKCPVSENAKESDTQIAPSQSSKETFFRRSESIYYDDGNVVVVAEGVAFRVHRSHLEIRSEVLRDLFTVAMHPDSDGAEVFDGCPVVRLSDLSMDVSRLLRMLYGYTVLDAKKTTQRDLGGLLRLSSKYTIASIRSLVIPLLAAPYPSTLKGWDAAARVRHTIGEMCYIIQAAHEAHADVLLPSAYYALCNAKTEMVLAQHLPSRIMDPFWLGKERLAIVPARFVDKYIVERNKCDPCRHTWHHILTKAHGYLRDPKWITCPDPLGFLLKIRRIYEHSLLCPECDSRFKAVVEQGRESVWSSLPQTFGLGTWDKLEKI